MKKLDLAKYRLAWNEETRFNDLILQEDEIKKYLGRKSKSITASFRNGLILDIILKIVLGASFIILIGFYLNNLRIISICAVSILLIMYLMYLQISVVKQIPGQKEYSDTLYNLLESEIRFYRSKFSRSVYINALSNPLLFLSGVLYYNIFKYAGVRAFDGEDYIVLGIMCIIGFFLGAFFQVRHYNFQIRQLEECLNELEGNGLTALTATRQILQNRKILITFLIAFILGLLLFGFLLLF
jgi:hypothetical protein